MAIKRFKTRHSVEMRSDLVKNRGWLDRSFGYAVGLDLETTNLEAKESAIWNVGYEAFGGLQKDTLDRETKKRYGHLRKGADVRTTPYSERLKRNIGWEELGKFTQEDFEEQARLKYRGVIEWGQLGKPAQSEYGKKVYEGLFQSKITSNQALNRFFANASGFDIWIHNMKFESMHIGEQFAGAEAFAGIAERLNLETHGIKQKRIFSTSKRIDEAMAHAYNTSLNLGRNQTPAAQQAYRQSWSNVGRAFIGELERSPFDLLGFNKRRVGRFFDSQMLISSSFAMAQEKGYMQHTNDFFSGTNINYLSLMLYGEQESHKGRPDVRSAKKITKWFALQTKKMVMGEELDQYALTKFKAFGINQGELKYLSAIKTGLTAFETIAKGGEYELREIRHPHTVAFEENRFGGKILGHKQVASIEKTPIKSMTEYYSFLRRRTDWTDLDREKVIRDLQERADKIVNLEEFHGVRGAHRGVFGTKQPLGKKIALRAGEALQEHENVTKTRILEIAERYSTHGIENEVPFNKLVSNKPLRNIWSTLKRNTLKRNPATSTVVGGLALASAYLIWPSKSKPTTRPITDEDRRMRAAYIREDRSIPKENTEEQEHLETKFSFFKQALERYGEKQHTGHKRISIPKSALSQESLERLGFLPTLLAIPEKGQDQWTSYRNPYNKYHLHSHDKNWVMHQDRQIASTMLTARYNIEAKQRKEAGHEDSIFKRLVTPLVQTVKGLPHTITEGVPGLFYYLRGRTDRMDLKLGNNLSRTGYYNEMNQMLESVGEKRVKISGKDDDYNTIEGLEHQGLSGQTRSENTDFGSGYKGLKEDKKKHQRSLVPFIAAQVGLGLGSMLGSKLLTSQIENLSSQGKHFKLREVLDVMTSVNLPRDTQLHISPDSHISQYMVRPNIKKNSLTAKILNFGKPLEDNLFDQPTRIHLGKAMNAALSLHEIGHTQSTFPKPLLYASRRLQQPVNILSSLYFISKYSSTKKEDAQLNSMDYAVGLAPGIMNLSTLVEEASASIFARKQFSKLGFTSSEISMGNKQLLTAFGSYGMGTLTAMLPFAGYAIALSMINKKSKETKTINGMSHASDHAIQIHNKSEAEKTRHEETGFGSEYNLGPKKLQQLFDKLKNVLQKNNHSTISLGTGVSGSVTGIGAYAFKNINNPTEKIADILLSSKVGNIPGVPTFFGVSKTKGLIFERLNVKPIGDAPHWVTQQTVDDHLQIIQSLHAKNIVHRDIHIGNLAVNEKGRGYLLDFGRAAEKEHLEILQPGLFERWKKEDLWNLSEITKSYSEVAKEPLRSINFPAPIPFERQSNEIVNIINQDPQSKNIIQKIAESTTDLVQINHEGLRHGEVLNTGKHQASKTRSRWTKQPDAPEGGFGSGWLGLSPYMIGEIAEQAVIRGNLLHQHKKNKQEYNNLYPSYGYEHTHGVRSDWFRTPTYNVDLAERYGDNPNPPRYRNQTGYYMSFSGFDDEYNNIEAFRHEGLASELRHRMTDFGSGLRRFMNWINAEGRIGYRSFLKQGKEKQFSFLSTFAKEELGYDIVRDIKTYKENIYRDYKLDLLSLGIKETSIDTQQEFFSVFPSNTILQRGAWTSFKAKTIYIGEQHLEDKRVALMHEISEVHYFSIKPNNPKARIMSHLSLMPIADETLFARDLGKTVLADTKQMRLKDAAVYSSLKPKIITAIQQDSKTLSLIPKENINDYLATGIKQRILDYKQKIFTADKYEKRIKSIHRNISNSPSKDTIRTQQNMKHSNSIKHSNYASKSFNN